MVARVNDRALRATGSLLRQIAVLHVRAQRDEVACCAGTTAAQCHILTELGRSGPLSITALGRRVGVDKGWISRAVADLVDAGLLVRLSVADDRRNVLVRLSSTGRRRVAALNRVLDAHAGRVLSRIPPAERERVQGALELVLAALREEQLQRSATGGCSRSATRHRPSVTAEARAATASRARRASPLRERRR
jgi:DNA-binding MarR family transcriptional regulator